MRCQVDQILLQLQLILKRLVEAAQAHLLMCCLEEVVILSKVLLKH
eukprot:CAMPEP_0115861742 /NCGR_PEP_ID=MMETSP0287-20121206/17811_1 /TAXON_ID=412157 /ORGANISM="Chrysochromulina rotalis, Strain UIO044" /LENGTH=45 /DNA_ID= /DNA_START= /DNA_END= /DNA_ORIENTATION=